MNAEEIEESLPLKHLHHTRITDLLRRGYIATVASWVDRSIKIMSEFYAAANRDLVME